VAAARGHLVVFDRHPVEEAAIASTGRGRGWVRRQFGRLLPEPDVLIVLDAPAAVVWDRRPEVDVPGIEELRRGYAKLAAGDRRARVVDASGSVGQVSRAVLEAVWQADRARANAR
jgi:thymidylate kinase